MYLSNASDIDRAVEAHWDRVWEEMNADTPYDVASDDEIRAFVYDNFDDEIESLMDEYGDTEEQAVDLFIKTHGDEIAERYNEHWAAEYGRGYWDD